MSVLARRLLRFSLLKYARFPIAAVPAAVVPARVRFFPRPQKPAFKLIAPTLNASAFSFSSFGAFHQARSKRLNSKI